MIKGVNKNAVIVKGKRGLFEQAIFILKPDMADKNLSRSEIERQIETFIKENTSRKNRNF